ncbi:hypothetical protein MTO96_007645 [Rhipicephalus appendiculatus]
MHRAPARLLHSVFGGFRLEEPRRDPRHSFGRPTPEDSQMDGRLSWWRRLREPLVADWIEVEGQAMGDLIVLPPASERRAPAFDEFHAAVRWVSDHCPKVRYIVKISADTLVHPTRLFKFLRMADANGLEALICEMRASSRLHHGTEAAVSVTKYQFFAGAYQFYCTGSVVVASLEMLRDSDDTLMPTEPEAAFVHRRSPLRNGDTSLVIRNVAVGSINSRVKRTFRWVGAFVVEQPREPLVAKWLEAEGDAEGDLIVLPPARNGSANGTHALRNVIRWASEHCTEARYVIKMADDTVVHPILLHSLLHRVDEIGRGALHCDMRRLFGVPPETDFVAFAPRAKFLAGAFDLYCAGSVVLASLKLLKHLDHATSTGSETVPSFDESHGRDGHGTLRIRNVAIDEIVDVPFDENWNATFIKLTGSTSRRRLDRYALWYSALWKDVLWSKSRFRKLLRGAERANDVFGKDAQG